MVHSDSVFGCLYEMHTYKHIVEQLETLSSLKSLGIPILGIQRHGLQCESALVWMVEVLISVAS